ncbi:hypothetical protein BN946_scf185043.g171 [Trametes cinnabarina]|uniref:Carboxypeptidase n=1 Tax=Pycnoporus cinnabarinus TaxID=5643 RepID=A0A060SIT8_PYCCI|nr:hypothetical protein BN946_scf185043.g171 [Trametes cinnabarina]
MFSAILTLALFLHGVLASSQVSFNTAAAVNPLPAYVGTYDSSGNVTTRVLSSITSRDKFTSLAHPRFPGHRVRVKKSDFCDPTVKFEGPGCSSSMGLLMELGPCNIDMGNTSSNGTLWNPYSWNAEANIFFLDQPVGVGFSYADFGETVETTEDAAKNVHAFLTIFFETFSEFKGRPLHLAGESYAGRYLPTFASYVFDQNHIAQEKGRQILNLTSVLIGNGITDISTLYAGRYEVECGTASLDVPFQKIGTCVRMKIALPRCQKAMQNSCVNRFDAIDCQAAVNFCDSELSTAYHESDYLNSPSIRNLLGVETPTNFTACSSSVGRAFASHLDKYAVPAQYYVAGLLERGVRVLIYAGTYDWQCNWVANKLWVDKLEWTGAPAYARAEWRGWEVDGSKAGETKSAGLLTFATVRGAGHMMSVFAFLVAASLGGVDGVMLTYMFDRTSRTTNRQKRRLWFQGVGMGAVVSMSAARA